MGIINRWLLNPKALVIARSMRDEPHRWALSSPNIFDGESYSMDCGRLRIWIANGWWFVSIYTPRHEKLGLIGRTLVWWQARKLASASAIATDLNADALRDIARRES